MTALFPLLIPAFLGYFLLTALLGSTPIRYKALFLAAISLPTGLGICSAILFFSLWIMPLHAKIISLTASSTACLAMACLFIARRFKSHRPFTHYSSKIFVKNLFSYIPRNKIETLKITIQCITFLIFLTALWAIIQFFILSVSTNITGGWDARYMWSLKAKFMFRSPADWQTMFSPKLSWSHPDYPLLWPGTLAWGWNFLGYESLLWPSWASLCFYISCTLILVWYLANHITPITGWVAGTFFLVLTPPLFWSIHQYADVPLTFFITTSSLMLATALREKQARLFIISGLMAGFAAWTKNEGFLFLLWISILIVGRILYKRRHSLPGPSFGKAFLGGVFLPLAGILAFKLFLGKTGDYFGPQRSVQDYLTLFFLGWKNLPMILQTFGNYMVSFQAWKGLWCFVLLACPILLFKKETNGHEKFLLALILLINLGYILAFLTTPNNLPWHLQTALERLLIHTSPLAIAFVFGSLTFRRNTP